MTSKQRVDAVLAGQTPDRVPWLPELNDGFIRKVIEQRGPAPEGVDDQTFVNQVIGADQLARLKAVREQWRHVEVTEDAEAPTSRPRANLSIAVSPMRQRRRNTRSGILSPDLNRSSPTRP